MRLHDQSAGTLCRRALVCFAAIATTVVSAEISLAADVFNIGTTSHAIVDDKTPVYPGGSPDTSNTFSTGYIYNIFGAANNGIEGTGDMLFADSQGTNFVKFHTSLPVDLSSISLSIGGEDGASGGNRGFSQFTFQAFTDNTYTTPATAAFSYTNNGIASGTPNTLATPASNAQFFQVTLTPSGNGSGVRVYSLTGEGIVVPEPTSMSLMGVAVVGLLRRRRGA